MSPMISAVSWAAGPTSAPVIPKTFHNPGTAFGGGGGVVYGSTLFDGTDDGLNLGQIDGTPLELGGLSNFTVEGWWKASTSMSLDSNQWNALISMPWHGQSNVNSQIWIGWAGSAYGAWNLSAGEFYIGLYMSDGTYETLNSSNTTIYNDNAWHHFALVKNGTSYSLFVDGVRTEEITTSKTLNTNLGGKNGYIGGYYSSSVTVGERLDFNGYVSNVRVSNTARYSGTTVTLPNSPFTSDANTLFLTCQKGSGPIIDASSNNRTIFVKDNAIADPTNPFTYGPGSVVFDGGEDYLKFPSAGTSNNLQIGTNDFTLEFWIKADSFTNGGVIYDTREGHANSLMVNFNTSGNLRVYANSGYRITADGISTGVWTHYAIVRDSGTTKLFLNGIQDTETYSDTNNYTGDTVFIGRHQSGVNVADFDGYISNLRLVVGTALYPPSPLGIGGDGPQGTGSCFFDGADDHIELVSQDSSGLRYLDNAANFTVEAWAYFTDPQPTDENNIFEFSTGDRIIFGRRKQASGRTCMYMYSAATSDLFVDDSAHDIPSDEWVHLAWVKQGTNIRMYKNGVNVVGNNNNSATNMPANMDAAVIHIGENYDGNEPMKGYLSNVRYSTTARYTSDFDVPTGPFENDSDTTLIICHRGDQIKDIIGRGSPTANGGVSASYSSPFLESTTSLTDITNTKLLTCNKHSGAITDESSIGHTAHVNSNAQSSTENPFSS